MLGTGGWRLQEGRGQEMAGNSLWGKARLRFQGKKDCCGSDLNKARRRGIAPPLSVFVSLWKGKYQ